MKKGFTLIEVLIVVVIIGVLAALVVPRMTAQVDRAKGAEALQMIGAIKRSLEGMYDLQGEYPNTSLNSIAGGFSIGWDTVGLQAPALSKNWSYRVFGDHQSYAALASASGPGSVGYSANEIAHTYVWTCTGIFAPMNGDATQGCKLS